MIVGGKKEVIICIARLEEARIAELSTYGVPVHAKIAPINTCPTERLINLQQLNLVTSIGETIYLEHYGEC
jgi:hypothetical protein